jgi:hypothetical protein
MLERLKISLSGMWLFVCVFTLLIPVFLPSFAGSANPATNVIGAATASMFILTFPSSLFGLPLLVFAGSILGVDPNSISGMYLNLFVMFVLGLVQWFWLVPRVLKWDTKVQVLNIPVDNSHLPPQTLVPADIFRPFDERDRTPIERIIRDDNELESRL